MTIRHLGPETMRRLQRVADEKGVSRAYAARLILLDHLLNLPPKAGIGTYLYEISRPGFDPNIPERRVETYRNPFDDWHDAAEPGQPESPSPSGKGWDGGSACE